LPEEQSNKNNPYEAPFFLFNGHLETIYPALLRRVQLIPYTRERIETVDGDFLDLDWLTQNGNSLTIICHGLEGNSSRAYIRGMARAFFQKGHDVLAWNYRGCSEEMNRKLRFYHSGATDDLRLVIQHAINKNRYHQINLVGFSLGGNLVLKYLGESPPPDIIHRAATFSVPVHLESSCQKISSPSNRVYADRFLRSLKDKIIRKASVMPELDIRHLSHVKTLQDFDDAYTAPLHGFQNAVDYYGKCSALYFLPDIKTPTLLVNTLNDPFLTSKCFPTDIHNPNLSVEIHARGGHVGFAQFRKNGLYWSEERALAFVTHG